MSQFGREMRLKRREELHWDLPRTRTERIAWERKAKRLISKNLDAQLVDIRGAIRTGIITGRVSQFVRTLLEEEFVEGQVLKIKWSRHFIRIAKAELVEPIQLTKDIAMRCGYRRSALLRQSLRDEEGNLPSKVRLYTIQYLGEKSV